MPLCLITFQVTSGASVQNLSFHPYATADKPTITVAKGTAIAGPSPPRQWHSTVSVATEIPNENTPNRFSSRLRVWSVPSSVSLELLFGAGSLQIAIKKQSSPNGICTRKDLDSAYEKQPSNYKKQRHQPTISSQRRPQEFHQERFHS